MDVCVGWGVYALLAVWLWTDLVHFTCGRGEALFMAMITEQEGDFTAQVYFKSLYALGLQTSRWPKQVRG